MSSPWTFVAPCDRDPVVASDSALASSEDSNWAISTHNSGDLCSCYTVLKASPARSVPQEANSSRLAKPTPSPLSSLLFQNPDDVTDDVVTVIGDNEFSIGDKSSEVRHTKKRRTYNGSFNIPSPRITQANRSPPSNSTEPKSANGKSRPAAVAVAAGLSNIPSKVLGKRRAVADEDNEDEGHATMRSVPSFLSAESLRSTKDLDATQHRNVSQTSSPGTNAEVDEKYASAKGLGKQCALTTDDDGDDDMNVAEDRSPFPTSFVRASPRGLADRCLSEISSSSGEDSESEYISEKQKGKRPVILLDDDDDEEHDDYVGEGSFSLSASTNYIRASTPKPDLSRTTRLTTK
ncbi:hypothetical protein CPB84DRAFT_559861 [Gymnopilus junonius]|uniref:Uncharacterized protein n=1 Tax=Gymnopilus junonius TaxID=109634 RepID=A0A9P5N8N2_GYMJU|nr:hypothetical protein CPB84DRAFT_559861 [Gymnopilus junonius]